jgi:hypothetical protein
VDLSESPQPGPQPVAAVDFGNVKAPFDVPSTGTALRQAAADLPYHLR